MAYLFPSAEWVEAFKEAINASEAYRRAYNAERMKAEVIHVKASELLANGKVAGRVDELKAEANKRHQYTVDDLVMGLEEIRDKALAEGQYTPARQSIIDMARLLGLLDGAAKPPAECKRFDPVERASRVLNILRQSGRS